MRILNVIVTGESDRTPAEIIDLHCYVVEEEQLSGEVVQEAEDKFVSILIGLGVDEDDIESYIEDGFYHDNGTVTVSLVWAYPENLQI